MRLALLFVLAGCSMTATPPNEVCETGALPSGDCSALCAESDPLPSCEVAALCAGGDTASPPATCRQVLTWGDHCDPDHFDDSSSLSQEGLLYAGELPYELSHATPGTTFTDAETWAGVVAMFNGDFPAVDFNTHLVVLAHHQQNATCGSRIEAHGVWAATAASQAQVFLRVEDSSGACFSTCDMEQTLGVLYAIPRSRGWPRVCADVVNLCP